MKQNRRKFIKFAGVAAAALCTAPAVAKAAGGGHAAPIMKNPKGLEAERWAMVIDTTKLKTEKDFAPLIEVCHKIHNVPQIDSNQEVKWLWTGSYDETFVEQPNPHMNEELKERSYALLCNHCANPPCVRVCPTKATFKRPDGIVAMDYHRCIGCRYCMAGCPYGSRSFNFSEPRDHFTEEELKKLNPKFPTRMRGVVEKCNFCVERLAVGERPACVEASKGAMFFGDLNDPESEVRQVLRERFTLRRKPSAGTEPSVYYII
ncbi:sulfate reduction electron transfer complex DsrMKJOP subunit DsrO [Desulfovibrio oxyclinae]|uniref:sulfate reduction electron transfer complex DsrMKJOP subunit DsrO n=1 Tax=Desulfovibrio oxyclinae TaxID=63560 RepID=UPI00035C8332|nr:4Fe-4S dicluster domain-containing protein [Desulfovibrio oxyclinae]